MSSRSRRRFVAQVALAGAATLTPHGASAAESVKRLAACADARVPLDGVWAFQLDADGAGERERWHLPDAAPGGWRAVTVPHTWQVEPASAENYGVAW
jgi:beta-galactosidase/beta-glucuronidase